MHPPEATPLTIWLPLLAAHTTRTFEQMFGPSSPVLPSGRGSRSSVRPGVGAGRGSAQP